MFYRSGASSMSLEAMVVNVTGDRYEGADFPSRTMHTAVSSIHCLMIRKLAHQLPKAGLQLPERAGSYAVGPLMRGVRRDGFADLLLGGESVAGPSTVPIGVLTIIHLASAMSRKSYRSWFRVEPSRTSSVHSRPVRDGFARRLALVSR
jgi:hypothetical protein